jgi:hypothetical protein
VLTGGELADRARTTLRPSITTTGLRVIDALANPQAGTETHGLELQEEDHDGEAQP